MTAGAMTPCKQSTPGNGHRGQATRRGKPSQPRMARGIGLIEVMVAVVLLAFGMLAIAALQATSLRNSQSALERTQAVVKSYTILDAMRANRDVAVIGGYDTGVITATDTVTSWTCAAPAAGDLAANNLHDWIESLHDTLGASSCAAIACGSLSCTVAVKWNDERGSDGNSAQELITSTRL